MLQALAASPSLILLSQPPAHLRDHEPDNPIHNQAFPFISTECPVQPSHAACGISLCPKNQNKIPWTLTKSAHPIPADLLKESKLENARNCTEQDTASFRHSQSWIDNIVSACSCSCTITAKKPLVSVLTLCAPDLHPHPARDQLAAQEKPRTEFTDQEFSLVSACSPPRTWARSLGFPALAQGVPTVQHN